jgi:hypothetical protein
MSMIAKKFNVTEYKVRKTVRELGIVAPRQYIHVILGSFLGEKVLDDAGYRREMKFCQRLFELVPDVRFWETFDFSSYGADSLAYFSTKGWEDQFLEMYELFAVDIDKFSFILDLCFGEKLSGKKRRKQLINAKKLYEIFPNEKFWRNFDFSAKPFCLSFYLTSFGVEEIRKKSASFGIEVAPTHREIISENRVVEKMEIKSRPRNIFEFLEQNG